MSRLPLSVTTAWRLLRRKPALAAARFVTVATIVTALSAVLTVANAALMKPLPFPDPERLVRVYFQPPGTSAFADADSLDALAFARLRGRARTLEAMVGIFQSDRTLTGDGEPESLLAGRVSEGFFSVLGAVPAAGRTFTAEEFANGAKAVVLSHGLWQRRFGADRAVVGRALVIDRDAHTIVGVVGPGFEPGFARSEFWTPLDLRAPNPYFSGIQTIGRLRPGATPAQVAGELNALLPAVAIEAPAAFKGWTLGAIDLREAQFGSRRPTILMLFGAVLGLALLAIANLANLTLADVLSRATDFAVRAALGGTRLQLVSADVVQGVMLSLAGGGAGLAGSWSVVPIVLATDPSSAWTRDQLAPDWRIVGGALLLAWLVMFAAVVAPTLRVATPGLAGRLASGARRAIGGRLAARIRLLLVLVQIALGVVLLSSGALVVAAFQRAARVDPGFVPDSVVTARLRLSEVALPTSEARAAFVERLVARLRETPGVVAASTTLNWFVPGQAGAQSLGFVEDRPTPDGSPYRIQSRRITPRYFETMRIPILRGRDFQDSDRMGAQPVAIVSRSFAERYWPGRDPIGRRVKRGVTTKDWARVVGVAADVRDVGLDQAPRDTLYTPFLQSAVSPLPVTLVVRTAGDPAAFVRIIKEAVWSVDPAQSLANIITLDEFLTGTLGPHRLRALLVTGYAIVGLLLATIGTYAVTSRAVVERTAEVGVRLALGGTPRRVGIALAAGSMRAVGIGALVGTAGAIAAAAGLAALLPEVHAGDWVAGAVAAAALALAGTIATLLAARRVLAIEPARALQP